MSDERLEAAVAAGVLEASRSETRDAVSVVTGLNQASREDKEKANGKLPVSAGNGIAEVLPAPDSLEASETTAIEEAYASTHQ